MILSSHNSFIFLDLKMYFSSCDSRYREIHYDLKVGNWNYNSYDEYDYSTQCYREINQSFVVLIIIDISSVIWIWNFVLDGDRVARIRDFEVRGELRNMEKGVSSEETLPTVYGIMIAFLTCVVGYILWVSVTTVADIILKKRYTVLFFFSWYIYK